MATAEQIVGVLSAGRFSLAREKETQAEIAARFDGAGLAYEREVDIGKRDIIDFLLGTVGLEVKIGGSKRAIHAQCARYCKTGKLSALILGTSVATGFPREIEGIPVYVVSFGRAWL